MPEKHTTGLLPPSSQTALLLTDFKPHACSTEHEKYTAHTLLVESFAVSYISGSLTVLER